MNLERCLHESPTSHLRAIAAFRKMDALINPSRSEMIAVLRDRLTDFESNKKLILELNGQEREILFQILDAGGSLSVGDLEKSWGSDDPEVARRWFWHKTVNPGLARLRLMGFLYCLRYREDKTTAYVLPEEFYPYVAPEPFKQLSDTYAPYRMFSVPRIILTDMFYLLKYVDEYNIRLLKTGGVPKRHKPLIVDRLNVLTPVTLSRDEKYITMLFSIAKDLGLLVQLGQKLEIDPKVTAWFSQEPFIQVREIFNAWLNEDSYESLRETENIQITTAGLRHPFTRVKRAFVSLLAGLPQDRWIPLKNFSDYFKLQRPFFYRPDHSPHLWQLRYMATREIIPAENVWENLEDNLIERMLSQQLAWLGLVDIGLSADEKVEAFMLTHFGHAVLSGKSNYSEFSNQSESSWLSQMDKILIQPDFEVLAPSGIILSIRDKLEKIAEFVSGGHVQKYKISRNSIASALESGFKSKEILDFLVSASQTKIPQNVERSIHDWIEEFGKIELKKTTLLKTQTPFLMQELLASSDISQFLGELIGPETVLITENQLTDLVNELKRMGHLPKVTVGNKTTESIVLKMDRETTEFLLRLLSDTLKKGTLMNNIRESEICEKLIERLTQQFLK